MKILCFIDSLGSGGAQRQLVTLTVKLMKRGHQIRFLVYRIDDHFLPILQVAGIPVQVIAPCSYLRRLFIVRKVLRQGWQDVVLAFLGASSLYAELSSIPSKKWGLVVGERSANPSISNGGGRWKRQFHRMADAVVCNSYTNQLLLEASFPFLQKKLCTVYNTVDLKLFRFSSDNDNTRVYGSAKSFRIVVAATYNGNKNMVNLAQALLILKEEHITPSILVDWFGDSHSDPAAFNQIERFVAENGLEGFFRLHHTIQDIASEYYHADAIGLFSFYEGLPNVICEGMVCGKPILLSNVCDASNLVEDGKNGFLCDPGSPEDIAEKIQRLVTLSDLERQKMGLESRRMAEHLFNDDKVIDRYEQILTFASRHELLPINCCWPTEAPESAVKSVLQW